MAQKNTHQFQGRVEFKDASGNGEAELEVMNQVPFRRSSGRCYYEEFFHQRPALNAIINTAYSNADATNAANTAIRLAEKVANRNFEHAGAGPSQDALCTFDPVFGGIILKTDTTDEDQMYITPHADTNQTVWAASLFGTENQIEFETAVYTPDIADMGFWAGMKLTGVPEMATDANQAYFLFGEDAQFGTLTTNTTLHFVYSVANTDYITDLGITVAVNTVYRLRISVDSDRKISIFVNDTQYSVANTAGATGGTTTSTGTGKSLALTDNIALVPVVGVETGEGAANQISCAYVKVSRIIYE